MKHLILITFAFLTSLSLFAQKKEITKEIEIEDFNSIEINGAFDVVFKQGDKPLAYLQGKEKLVEKVQVKQNGKFIEFRNSDDGENTEYDSNNKARKIVLFIQFVDLKKVETAMAGEISCDNHLNFNSLDFNFTGAGDAMLDLSAKEFNLEFDGVGKVTIKGEANQATMECNGVGKVMAREFIVRDLVAECNGIGSMHVNAENSIKMSASGIGSVKNFGNAQNSEK